MADGNPVVFISYSHDSDSHTERVRGFAASLSRDGCDCRLDVYKDTDEDWPTWMERQLLEDDIVLCVVTETYHQRFQYQELPDVGQGVGWEAGLIRRILYAKKLHNDRIIPVVFDASDRQHIPLALQGYDHFVLDGATGYEDLLRKVLSRPRHARPAIGTAPDMPTYTTEPLFPRPGGDEPPELSTPPALPQRIASSRLLDLGVADRFEELVGREAERQFLTGAWHANGVRIVVLVAGGGVGKTSLVADWLMDFVNTGWEGVDTFFDWSFYSQGTRDQTAANSDQFFNAALRHFGEVELADSPASADDKAKRLAERIAGGRTLLLLDGVEPMQHPQTQWGMEGRFKDTGIERLLKRLAQLPSVGGLCVVTTRVPVVDLRRFHSATVREHLLDRLSETATAQLLHKAGARQAGGAAIAPDDRELLEAARELGGHALTAQLLGGYLKQAYGGDIRQRDRVDWTRAIDEHQEGHAGAVMEAYERWFELHGEAGQRELATLRLLGFFDRPASADCLEALRRGEVIEGLTEPLAEIVEEDWQAILTRLADEHGLISLERAGGRIVHVDSHPLVRAYFAWRLRDAHEMAWTEGHRRLYEHLCETTEHRPDTLDGLQPLYQAVVHGCLAGLHQQACDDVYFDRILRGTEGGGFYSSRKLGAVGANLGAVACFFDHPWRGPSSSLSADDQSWLLNQASFCLRALNRLTEAVEPMRAALEMYVEQENWRNAAIQAGNLSELKLILGEVSTAIADAEQSVEFADRSGDAGQREINLTTYADALHQAGRRDEAQHPFAEAESMQAARRPQYPWLFSLQGFQYCDLLLSGAECAAWQCQLALSLRAASSQLLTADRGRQTERQQACGQVSERATQSLKVAERNNWLLDIALDHLTLGRAALYWALLSQSDISVPESLVTVHLIAAVDGLRKAGTMHFLPLGLLTRAWQRHLMGDASGATVDLDEAWEIAERGPMPLHQADILLTRARLFFRDDLATARTHLAEARRLIENHGYHRRDEELADAEEALRLWSERG